jgi:uncharacterized membrane protein
LHRACDKAFIIRDNVSEGLISLSVIPLSEKSNLTTSIIIPVTIVCVLCVAAFLWYDYKRRQNDMIWMVKQEELHFDSPPEVIGRGTFGLVLLAGMDSHYKYEKRNVSRANDLVFIVRISRNTGCCEASDSCKIKTIWNSSWRFVVGRIDNGIARSL